MALTLTESLALSGLIMTAITLIVVLVSVTKLLDVTNGFARKINAVTNSANVAMMLSSTARGVTEGIAEAVFNANTVRDAAQERRSITDGSRE